MKSVHTYSNETAVWNVADLWKAAKDLVPVMVQIESIIDIEELLDSHTWSAGPMTVREILDHVDRIANADLSYPIILAPEGWICDGCHRLIRAWREGKTYIEMVQLKEMPVPILTENESDHG